MISKIRDKQNRDKQGLPVLISFFKMVSITLTLLPHHNHSEIRVLQRNFKNMLNTIRAVELQANKVESLTRMNVNPFQDRK